jgi:hypothetical protein
MHSVAWTERRAVQPMLFPQRQGRLYCQMEGPSGVGEVDTAAHELTQQVS